MIKLITIKGREAVEGREGQTELKPSSFSFSNNDEINNDKSWTFCRRMDALKT